jgi:hypothetical protein
LRQATQFIKHIPEILYPADEEKNRLRYFGQLGSGIPNGSGTMTWKDGQSYKGTKMIKSIIHFLVHLIQS